MDGRLYRTICDEAGDYVVPNVLSPRDLVSRPDNMDETVQSSCCKFVTIIIQRSITVHPIHVKVKGIAVKPEVSTRVRASVGLLVSTVKLVRTNH